MASLASILDSLKSMSGVSYRSGTGIASQPTPSVRQPLPSSGYSSPGQVGGTTQRTGTVSTQPVGGVQRAIPYNGAGGGTTTPQKEESLRFNPQYAGQYRNLDAQQVNVNTERNTGLSRINSDYTRQKQEGTRLQKLAIERLRERMSDQGILRSGVTVGAQSDSEGDFLRYLDELALGKSRGIEDVEMGTQRALTAIGLQREQAMQSQAREEAMARQQEALNKARMEQQQPQPTSTGQLVRNAFQQYGVPFVDANGVTTGGESADQRVTRIAQSLDSGSRTSENFIDSLKAIQQRSQPQQPNYEQQVRAMFAQYGVNPQGTGPESADARIGRIAQELQAGRTTQNLAESLQRIAANGGV